MKRPQECNTGGWSLTQMINTAVSDYSYTFTSNRTNSLCLYKQTKQGKDTGPRATAEPSGLLHTQQDLELCFGLSWLLSVDMVEGMVKWGTTAARLPLVEFKHHIRQLCAHSKAMAQLASQAEKSPWPVIFTNNCCFCRAMLSCAMGRVNARACFLPCSCPTIFTLCCSLPALLGMP